MLLLLLLLRSPRSSAPLLSTARSLSLSLSRPLAPPRWFLAIFPPALLCPPTDSSRCKHAIMQCNAGSTASSCVIPAITYSVQMQSIVSCARSPCSPGVSPFLLPSPAVPGSGNQSIPCNQSHPVSGQLMPQMTPQCHHHHTTPQPPRPPAPSYSSNADRMLPP